MQYRTLGILAHVDAGKTTLTEAILYLTGQIRSFGRVDHGDTHLDTDEIERERGITIFSSQARVRTEDMELILLDTPGHADFSAETERVMQVLDAAVLVISGTDGVQPHTRTLWKLLRHYGVPVLIFVNKMDLAGADREAVLEELKTELLPECVDFGLSGEALFEEIAVCGEDLLETLMDHGTIPDEMTARAVCEGRLCPVWFGSALRMENLDGLIEGLGRYTLPLRHTERGDDGYAARVYKIGRDPSGARLTFLRVTGGALRTRMPVRYQGKDGEEHCEKIDQIRLYSGERFEQTDLVSEGQVCAVTGLSSTMPGCGLGDESSSALPVIEPVMTRSLILPRDVNPSVFLRKIAPLSEEEPTLHIVWNAEKKCIDLQIMGEVQAEVLTKMIMDRFGVRTACGPARIIYRETVTKSVEGVGHFEPLRHYAEVHLLIEPGERGSGVAIRSSVSEDDLDLHWQRLILSNLLEKEHAGVLTGSALTDVRITLIAGKAHLKHTEGGDFRQAALRAVRQGLMSTECALLEPYYAFILEVPQENLGRAMTDLTGMQAVFGDPEFSSSGGKAVLSGTVPVSLAGDYMSEVISYTRGEGSLSLSLSGYLPCHNPEQVIEAAAYDPDADTENPASSVFCAHGAGFVVPWDEVPSYAHLPCLKPEEHKEPEEDGESAGEGFFARSFRRERGGGQEVTSPEEDGLLMSIYNREFGSLRQETQDGPARRRKWGGTQSAAQEFRQKYDKHGEPIYPKKDTRGEHLIVDGYNIIFQWEELRALADKDIGAARGKLLDLLSNYQGYLGHPVTVVFDAYRTGRNPESVSRWQNLTVVFTKERETADAYIERMVHEENRRFRFTVATSDGMEQLTVLRLGALRMSARMLAEDMNRYRQSPPG